MHPHIDRGVQLTIKPHHTDWIIRYWMLRMQGVVLAGPSPREFMDPVSKRELRQAVVEMMWWWEQQLSDTQLVAEDGYQWYTVQTMCRISYTTATGEIVSRPAASP